ncbi:Pyridoxamine 5'-phosphate oxidase family protein [uncultured Desulfobacterium sp.]|uniref:Pyridoxamine 5'-phosphate oxidase family protein n=1 Tax=uncultured Desulfobacterium sp. TaxID=201089 RepID=A0A445N416_9BACT|nr:Pyridoxamine 5'-phosphate oxidase family protein [uncultured Desulfobacterium sp.]
MENKRLENYIMHYIETHNTMSLATERDGKPHAATVFFINIGFDLYFFSSPTSRHGENFSLNPMVSATINEDYSDWQSIKGIQLEGVVTMVGGILENIRLSRLYIKKFPDVVDFLFSPQKLGAAIARKVAGVNYYKLEPSKIYFLNNELGFGHRDELILK